MGLLSFGGRVGGGWQSFPFIPPACHAVAFQSPEEDGGTELAGHWQPFSYEALPLDQIHAAGQRFGCAGCGVQGNVFLKRHIPGPCKGCLFIVSINHPLKALVYTVYLQVYCI